MRIGLVSDTHNDRQAVGLALARLRSEGIATILHAGDVTSSSTLRLFEGFDVWIARGNMDHDTGLVTTAGELFGSGRLKQLHQLALGGVSIALAHDSSAAEIQRLISAGQTDYVVVGHSHRRHDQKVGHTRVINPGALGNARWDRPSFAILDTGLGDLASIEL